MKNIELVISEAIKKGKWIDISYINTQKETTFYWIAIKDIDLNNKILYVSIFNAQKSLDSLEAKIKFEKIISIRYKPKANLANSLGWKEKPKILNQHLAPLVEVPKNKTKTNKIIEKR